MHNTNHVSSSNSTSARRSRFAPTIIVGCVLALVAGSGSSEAVDHTGNPRHYDARFEAEGEERVHPTGEQLAAEAAWRASIPGLTVTYDGATGAARTISNLTGYLSDPLSEGELLTVLLAFAGEHRDLLGLTEVDLANHEVTDSVFSRVSGATHLYLRQTHNGLAVYNGQLHFNANRDRRVISINNAFVPNLAAVVNTTEPGIDAAIAVLRAAEHLGLELQTEPTVLAGPTGIEQLTEVDSTGISREPITARLMWLPIPGGRARLVWNFLIHTIDGEHVFDFTVDAVSGQVWTRADRIADAEYTVYAMPVESPNHTTPPPPADARTVEVDPHDTTASPFAWHDTDGSPGAEFTIMRGNNVHAYDDSNSPPPTEPDCGPNLECNFPIDLSQQPSVYKSAAVANLFYWNNIIHDVQYQYGFDEAAGNFQQNNYGNGGIGGDSVKAEAQDRSGTCNANFDTPADGSRPTMQMYICGNASPWRDGDLDNGVIVHEYGHGISTRLVGGPSQVFCLFNNQQPGEGWSDWLGLAYTVEIGDQGTDYRGMGTYLFGQPASGPGIRPQPYSTDPAINNYTYESIAGLAIPHGVGSVWAQAIWEVYWALVGEYGFDPDLYNATGGSGNQRIMLYVNEGMKNTACNPTFLDARDGIIQAAVDNYGGDDVCLVWEAFAAFGLGVDASTSGPNSTTANNGFEIPIECQCTFPDAPTGLAAAAAGDNEISLSWTSDDPAADTFNIYRAIGSCPGSDFELIASGITGTSYLDTTVSGLITYSYMVTAMDITEQCESDTSNCAEAQTTGDCLEPPAFDGLQSVTNTQASTCTLDLAWNAASDYCGGPVSYNVYRSTTSGFTPDDLNRIATGVVGTSYSDDDGVDFNVEQFYIVRSVDQSNSAEDGNLVEHSDSATGTIVLSFEDDFEGGNQGWVFTDTSSTGDFLIGDPIGTSFSGHDSQPEDDHTPGGVNCLYTDENPTGEACCEDIDDGEVVATSPTFDGTGAGTMQLDMWRWFSNRLSDDSGDYYYLEVSNNDGSTWTELENIPGTNTSTNSWTNVSFDLGSFITLTSTMKIRVRAADGSATGDLVELAIDDIVIDSVAECTTGASPLIFADGFESGDTSVWSLTVE